MTLPPGWEETLIPEVAFFQEGPGLRKFQYRDDGVRFLNIRTLVDERVDLELCKYLDETEVSKKYEHFLLIANDIVISSSGTIGKTAIIRDEDLPLILNTSIVRFRPHADGQLNRGFLHLFLKSQYFLAQARKASTGSAQVNFGPSHLKKMTFLLPPINEQKRISQKAKSLFERSRRAKQTLDAIPPLLAKLRQSILAAAFRGDLTADWRAQNPNVEPATNLLTRIRQERRTQWEQTELAKTHAKGKQPKNDKWKTKYKSPRQVDLGGLSTLPVGWVWSKLDELVAGDTTLCYGVVQPGPQVDGGVPLVRVRDLSDGSVKTHQLRTISTAVDAEYQRTKLAGGELLVSVVGTVGRVAVATEAIAGANIARAIAKVSPTRFVRAGWIALWLETAAMQDWLVRGAREVARKTLNIEVLRHAPIPIAPQHEMEAVLSHVDAALANTRRVRAAHDDAAERFESIDKAILAKAFCGELVKQDAKDEPASVLLRRIRTAREAGKPVSKSRTRRVGGKKTALVKR